MPTDSPNIPRLEYVKISQNLKEETLCYIQF